MDALREQFETFVINEGYRVYRARKHPSVPVSVADAYADSAVELAWQTFQLGHAVNADLIQALHECIGWFEDNQVDCIALDEARDAIKKARAE